MSDPIIVNESATPAQVSAGFRQLILTLSAAASALGMAGVAGHLNGALAFAGVVGTVGAFLWGQFATRFHAKQAAQLATMLQDSKAQTK